MSFLGDESIPILGLICASRLLMLTDWRSMCGHMLLRLAHWPLNLPFEPSVCMEDSIEHHFSKIKTIKKMSFRGPYLMKKSSKIIKYQWESKKIVLFFLFSSFLPPSSCRILGHFHLKRPPKIIYPSLHSIESICQGFILWGATGWWRPKIIFSMLTVVFLIVFFSCSFQGLVTIGLLWIVFFLFFSGWEFIWWGAER